MSALPLVANDATPQHAFGLHKINRIWYLFQDTLPEGAALVNFQDLPDFYSGKNTDLAGIGGACTHNINPSLMHRRIPKCQWSHFCSMAKDPLVELFLPVPLEHKNLGSNRVFILDNSFNPSWFFLVKNLERLVSPVHSKVDLWLPEYQSKRISDLELSNIHPLVYSLTGSVLSPLIEKQVISLSLEANNAYIGRPVLLIGNSSVCSQLKTLLGEKATMIKSELTDRSLVTNTIHYPFEHMGARVMGYFGTSGVLRVV
jgi:hypothetical protein